MKHTIFSILLCLLLVSCEAWTRRQTDYHYIINQTDKEIVHILYNDHELIKEDSLVFQISENSDTKLEWKISAIVGFGDNFGIFGYTKTRFYNLTDTMSIYIENLDNLLYGTNSIQEFLNTQYLDRESNKCKKETDDITKYYWCVNDSLLSLMQKDYSMTERFKEYYQK